MKRNFGRSITIIYALPAPDVQLRYAPCALRFALPPSFNC